MKNSELVYITIPLLMIKKFIILQNLPCLR